MTLSSFLEQRLFFSGGCRLVPTMVDRIDESNEPLLHVDKVRRMLAISALEDLIGVGGGGLAEQVELLLLGARNVLDLGTADGRVEVVELADSGICFDLVAEGKETGGTQVRHVVISSVIEVEVPVCGVVLVCCFQVEGVDFEVYGEHCFRIKVDQIVTWGFTLVCSH